MDKKNILIIGNGGREHALGWKLKQSSSVKKIYFAPGNGGTRDLGENIDIGVSEIKKLIKFAKNKKIDLTVVGPEVPLAQGIVDFFNIKKLKIFGPIKKAAQLESSKAWAADFLERNNIPHPFSKVFTDFNQAKKFIDSVSANKIVIKANGLAAGKGVILPTTNIEALDTIKRIMINHEFGDAGNTVVIQERLSGAEVSVLALSDGKTILPLLPAQDHKRVFDHDQGVNTGGMGAYSPVKLVNKKLFNQIKKKILQPTIDAMRKEGIEYKGVLYAGLMITKDEPKVLEFNVRFGDPETQPQMLLLKSNLFDLMNACINGTLNKQKIQFKNGVAVCVVLVSGGYPGSFEKEKVIHGLNKKFNQNIQIFHAGTTIKNGKILTSGGRVLGITGFGRLIKHALKNVYHVIGKKGIYFDKMHYRKDIGVKAMKYGTKN
jgi:phosphoribosylamine---glycine ligase